MNGSRPPSPTKGIYCITHGWQWGMRRCGGCVRVKLWAIGEIALAFLFMVAAFVMAMLTNGNAAAFVSTLRRYL